MLNVFDFYRLLAVTALLNLVLLTPDAISWRLAKRQDAPPQELDPNKPDVGLLPANISRCAQDCILGAYTGSSLGCIHDDFTCICKSQSFLNSTLACYANTCPPSEGHFANAWVTKSCAAAGVNVVDIVTVASHPNGTLVLSHAQNSTNSASQNAKKSAGNRAVFTKTSASLLVGASLAALLI